MDMRLLEEFPVEALHVYTFGYLTKHNDMFRSYLHVYVHVYTCGRALCLECRVSWVRVPPEAPLFFRKSDCLGCAVLLCLVCLFVCLFDLACFFLSSFSSLIKTCIYTCTCIHIINPRCACAARVTVVVLCVCVCVCTTILGLQATRRLMDDTNSFSATRARNIMWRFC